MATDREAESNAGAESALCVQLGHQAATALMLAVPKLFASGTQLSFDLPVG